MTQDHINVGPLRPTTGPLAGLGGQSAAQPSGGGTLPSQVRELQEIARALQDQLYAQGQFFNQLISVPMMIASGDNHQPGVVPDPGSVSGTSKFLREDATYSAVSATALSGIVPVANGGTGTATGSITGTGDITFTAGGSGKNVVLVSSGTGKIIAKPGTDSTTAIQLQNAAGTAIATVDTSAARINIAGVLAVPPSVVVCVNGANADVAIGSRTYARVGGPTGAFSISGFAGGSDGQFLEVWNSSGQALTIKDVSSGLSTAGNRIFTQTGGDVVLAGFSFVSFIYDAAGPYWVLRSHT